MTRTWFFFGAALVFLSVVLAIVPARGNHEDPPSVPDETNRTIRVRGRVAYLGNDPHSFLAINLFEPLDGNGTFRLYGPLVDVLARNQQQDTVTLLIKITRESPGPGFPPEAEVLEIVSPDE